MLSAFTKEKFIDRQTNADLSQLLEIMPIFAAHRLCNAAEFLPFATAITSDGLLNPISIEKEEDLRPSEILEQLEELVQRELSAGRFVACGICTNVITHPEESNTRIHAICLSLSCSIDFKVRYYIPYEMFMSDFPLLKQGFFRRPQLQVAS